MLPVWWAGWHLCLITSPFNLFFLTRLLITPSPHLLLCSSRLSKNWSYLQIWGFTLWLFFWDFLFFFFFTCLGISGFIFWLLKPLTLWFITWVLVFPSLIAREISQIKNCKNTLVTQCSILFSRVDFPPVSAFKYLLWIFPQSL